MAQGPINYRGYNDYASRKDDEKYVRPKVNVISGETKRALEELEFCKTWDDFVKICEAQKEKRGW